MNVNQTCKYAVSFLFRPVLDSSHAGLLPRQQAFVHSCSCLLSEPNVPPLSSLVPKSESESGSESDSAVDSLFIKVKQKVCNHG